MFNIKKFYKLLMVTNKKMVEEPIITNTRTEIYDHLILEGRSFTVQYILNTLEYDGKVESLDDHVILYETVFNQYETPRMGNDLVPKGVTKGRAGKTEVIRSVMRDLSSGQNYVEIQQWREIPQGLEKLIDGLPNHVKDLLKTEYSDSGVTPYDFGYPVE